MPASEILVRLRMLGQQRFNAESKHIAQDIGQIGSRAASIVGPLIAGGQALGAFSLGAVGLGAALAPVLGLVGGIPAAGALAGQGLGVAMLGVQGVTDAVGGLNEALDPEKFATLTDEGRAFALELDSLKGPVRDLQSAVQAEMLPGFSKGLESARPALDALKGPLGDTGGLIGDLGGDLGKLVGSGGFLADLKSQAGFNNVQLRVLGGAGLHLVNVFRNLMVGGRPLVAWLVKLVAGWAATADRVTTAGRESGKMAGIFETVRKTTAQVFQALWDVGVSLFRIGVIGKREVGDGILVHLVAAAAALKDWTGSKEGIDEITRAFRWARETIRDIGDFLERANNEAGPGVAEMLRNLVDAINPILESGGSVGVLALYAGGMNLIAQAAGLLVNNVPGAADALSALFAVMLVNKLAGANVVAIAIRAIAVAAAFAFAPMAGLSTAFWAVNAAIAANPIGAAVIAIAALAAGLIYAYKHSETFRDIVDGTAEVLKTGLLWVVEAIIDALNFLGGGLSTVFSGLAHIPGLGFLKDAANAIDDARAATRDWGNALDDITGTRTFTMAPTSRSRNRTPAAVRAAENRGAFSRGPAARLPGMAAGGTVARGGMVRVGEHGEETVELPSRAVVHPHDGGDMSGLVAAFDRLSAVMQRVATRPVSVQVEGREIARANAIQLANEAAFA